MPSCRPTHLHSQGGGVAAQGIKATGRCGGRVCSSSVSDPANGELVLDVRGGRQRRHGQPRLPRLLAQRELRLRCALHAHSRTRPISSASPRATPPTQDTIIADLGISLSEASHVSRQRFLGNLTLSFQGCMRTWLCLCSVFCFIFSRP